MTLEISSNKAMKLSNSSEFVLQSLPHKKTINPCKKCMIQLNIKKLDLTKAKRMKAGILKFEQKVEQDEDLTMKKVAQILKAANRPEKLEVTCKECYGLSNRGLGYISEGIKRLTSLKDLKLEFSECEAMTDEGMKVIAKALKNLTSLQKLTLKFRTEYLQYTAFSDRGVKYLGRALQKLFSLEIIDLDLSEVKITDLGIQYLGHSLKRLGSLKTLHVHFKNNSQITFKTLKDFENIDLSFANFQDLSDKAVHSFSERFTKYTSLKNLGLYFEECSAITGEAMALFGKNLKKINSLQSINFGLIGCQQITETGIIYLYEGLRGQKSLTTMNLKFVNCSKIANASMKAIADGFKTPAPLKHLILHFSQNNEIDDTGIEILSEGIDGIATSLQNLEIGFSSSPKITNNGMKTIASIFKKLLSLNDLIFNFSQNNEIDNAAIEYLSQGFKNLSPSLQSLHLGFSGCPGITNTGMQTIANAFRELPPIRHLTLDFSLNKEIDDTGTRYLFEGIEDLASSLQSLHLVFSGTEFSSRTIFSLGEASTKLTVLESISLNVSGCNNIYICNFNESFGKSKSIKNISLDFSNIEMLFDNEEGNFVYGMSQLKSIQSLYLSFANCWISDDEIKYLVQVFKEFTSLQSITLDFTFRNYCLISEEMRDELCEVFSSLPRIKQYSILP